LEIIGLAEWPKGRSRSGVLWEERKRKEGLPTKKKDALWKGSRMQNLSVDDREKGGMHYRWSGRKPSLL